MSILSDVDSNNWIKFDNDLFDVPMGIYMGAEVCDLIELFY